MPRPNPPRKRPRKRPAASRAAVRADAALTKQTAQSTQTKAPAPAAREKPPSGRGAAVAAAPAPDEMWSRRSYATLVVLVGIIQLPVAIVYWALQPAASKVPLAVQVSELNPITLIVASLLAAPIARLVTHERRPLRFIESIFVGIVAYFIWIFLVIAVGFLLFSQGANSSSGSVATPCPATGSCTPSASVTASPSASGPHTPAPSRTPQLYSPAATPGPAHATTTSSPPVAAIYAAYGVIEVLAYLGTFYVYPPLYRRLRVRRPPPQRKPPEKKGTTSK